MSIIDYDDVSMGTYETYKAVVKMMSTFQRRKKLDVPYTANCLMFSLEYRKAPRLYFRDCLEHSDSIKLLTSNRSHQIKQVIPWPRYN